MLACDFLTLTRLGLVDASSSSEEREHLRGEIAVDLEGGNTSSHRQSYRGGNCL